MFLIRDNTDLGGIKENEKVVDFKKRLSDSLKTKSNKSKIVTKDSSTKKSTSGKNIVYMLVSTTDKVINGRTYDFLSYINNIVNKDFLSPYAKPILRHHDDHQDSVGRVKSAWHIKHDTKEIISDSQEELPKDVFDFFEAHGAFEKGTGSIIAKANVDDATFQRIQDELDVTVSYGQTCSGATCNICHKDYFGDECEHVARETYTVDGKEMTCTPHMLGLSPLEVSIVNTPANDTSLLYIPNSSTPALTNDSKEEENKNSDKIDNHGEVCKDGSTIEEKTEKTVEVEIKNEDTNIDEKKGDVMFKDLLKKSMLDSLQSIDEKVHDSFGKLFDLLETEEQVSALKEFADTYKGSLQTSENETKEEVVEEEVEETTEDETSSSEEENIEESAESEEKNIEETATEEVEDEKNLVEQEIKDAQEIVKENKVKTVEKTTDQLIIDRIIQNM